MALGIFSSRWILQGLGPIDYGLMAVVGALIAFVTFLNGAMAVASARFFAYSIGRGDVEDTNRWFNVSLCIHLIAPLCLVTVGWFVGEWALEDFLNIPPLRIDTARWVFRLSMLSAFQTMALSPFLGMFIAKQHITEISIWRTVTSLANFCLAYAVLSATGDSWLFYCIGSVTITIALGMTQVFRALRLFKECRINFDMWWDYSKMQKVLSFSGWSLFGAAGGLLRSNGIAILLNKYFNPVSYSYVNASYAVGITLSNYTQTLSASLMGAFVPEMTANEGSGERQKMLNQASQVSKLGTYLTLLFAVPLLLEIDYVLELWLQEPPQLAASMCSLILFTFIIDRLSAGQMVAVAANGRIAGYQMMLGGFLILTLPIAWFFLEHEFDAVSVCWAYIITVTMCSVGRVLWAKKLVGLSPRLWVKDVLIPCSTVLAVGLVVGSVAQMIWAWDSFLRLCVVIATTLFSSLLLGWLVVLKYDERRYFLSGLRALLRRFFVKAS